MDCRPGCGACCTAISISSPLPGLPGGKPAGVRCVNLDPDDHCRLWGAPNYPSVCRGFGADPEHCGASRAEAFVLLESLERATRADWEARLLGGGGPAGPRAE